MPGKSFTHVPTIYMQHDLQTTIVALLTTPHHLVQFVTLDPNTATNTVDTKVSQDTLHAMVAQTASKLHSNPLIHTEDQTGWCISILLRYKLSTAQCGGTNLAPGHET